MKSKELKLPILICLVVSLCIVVMGIKHIDSLLLDVSLLITYYAFKFVDYQELRIVKMILSATPILVYCFVTCYNLLQGLSFINMLRLLIGIALIILHILIIYNAVLWERNAK